MSNRDILLRSYETGTLPETIHACSLADRGDSSLLVLELVALHNEGLVDVVAAFASLKDKLPNASAFFTTRDVFEKALPELYAPVPSVMRCVRQLYHDAGQDLCAGTIINSFAAFCAKTPSRPREALAEIKANPDEFADLLPATLIAGSRIDFSLFLRQTLRLFGDNNMSLRRGAISAVGNLHLPEGASETDAALAALEHVAAVDSDDQLLARVIKSAFLLLQRDKSQELRATSLINLALAKGDEYALHSAAEIFGLYTGDLPPGLLDALCAHLIGVKRTNKGTLDKIDFGISYLLKTDNPGKAMQFLEDLLLAHSGDLTMEVFDSASRELLASKMLMSKVVTRWFLRGDRILGDGVGAVIAAHRGDDVLLEVDPTELTPADSRHFLFVARKAIGFLFTQPISAASILISLMRHAIEDDLLTNLGALLFDPLLLNFTGKVRTYAVHRSGLESGKVKATIDQALENLDEYLEELRSVGNLAALHPGEAQQEAYRRHITNIMTESWKAAEAQSVFLNLVSRSVLLYGNKSVHYVYGPAGQSDRMEIPLLGHSAEMEFPRMQTLDPFGLDHMLRVFRNEPINV